MGYRKEVKALLDEAEEAGAVYVGLTGSGHHKMTWKGKPFFVAQTPSCSRNLKNTRALMRRIGVPLPR